MGNVLNLAEQKIARLVGAMFLLTLLVPSLNWFFVLSKFMSGNDVGIAENFIKGEFLFRINIVNEIITSVIIVIFAVSLYSLFKSVSGKVALIALGFRLIDAILSALLAFGHLLVLLALNERNNVSVSPSIYSAAGACLKMHIELTALSGVFMGLGMFLFSILIFKSAHVPRTLAAFGIVSYFLVLIYDFTMVLSPEQSKIVFFQIAATAPVCLFQLVIGGWLLLKGWIIK